MVHFIYLPSRLSTYHQPTTRYGPKTITSIISNLLPLVKTDSLFKFLEAKEVVHLKMSCAEFRRATRRAFKSLSEDPARHPDWHNPLDLSTLCLSKAALESVVGSEEEEWYVSGINMCFEVDFGEEEDTSAAEESTAIEESDGGEGSEGSGGSGGRSAGSAVVPSALQTILTSQRLRSINANWNRSSQQKYGHTGKPLNAPLVKGNVKVTRCAAHLIASHHATPHRPAPPRATPRRIAPHRIVKLS